MRRYADVPRYYQNEKMAVLISPGWGAGWSTWASYPEIAYDARVVEKFIDGATEKEMKELLEDLGYNHVYMGGYSQLCVEWVPKGVAWMIQEYDGYERVETSEYMYEA